jgi:hypothetical protein
VRGRSIRKATPFNVTGCRIKSGMTVLRDRRIKSGMTRVFAMTPQTVIPEVRRTHIGNPAAFNDTGCRIESGMTGLLAMTTVFDIRAHAIPA